MSRRNAGYPLERARHAPSEKRGVGLCGAGTRGSLGVYIGNPKAPAYKPNGVSCERCKAKLKKAGTPVPETKAQAERLYGRKTITFSELTRLQLVSKTSGLYQMGKNRYRDVGIGMVDEGPADGTETLVTEDDGTVPT